MNEPPTEDAVPTDEQMREWFPKLFSRSGAEVEELKIVHRGTGPCDCWACTDEP